MSVTTMSGVQRFLETAAGRPADRTPVWFMRQAGRALASYRALRERHDLLTMVRTPELAAQVTLLPVRELGVDAAVMYADIMIPLLTLGVGFTIDPGVGPVIAEPVRTAEDVARLRLADHRETIPEIFTAIEMVRRELEGRTAVLGFAGAPFTVASYLVEGRASRECVRVRAMMHSAPEVYGRLMDVLTATTIAYLDAQADAGAQAVQLFDSWCGVLSRRDYEAFVLPYTRRILKALRGKVPMINFGTGTAHLLDLMAEDCDVVGVDWRLPLDDAWNRIGPRAIQGNLDPVVATQPWPVAEREALRVLEAAGGRAGHIFNLGHGVLPETPEENLHRLVDLVRDHGG